MTSFLHAYFTRLHCQPLGVPTVEALRTLHLAHNCAIPFENLDVLLPREIQLDETALEEKLLYARRARTVCCWLMLRTSSGSRTWGLAAKR